MTLTPLELTRPASVTDAFLQQLVARVPGSSGATWKLTAPVMARSSFSSSIVRRGFN